MPCDSISTQSPLNLAFDLRSNKLLFSFQAFDTDQDGQLTPNELGSLLQLMQGVARATGRVRHTARARTHTCIHTRTHARARAHTVGGIGAAGTAVLPIIAHITQCTPHACHHFDPHRYFNVRYAMRYAGRTSDYALRGSDQ